MVTRDRHPISGSFGASWHLPPADLTSPPISRHVRLPIVDCRSAKVKAEAEVKAEVERRSAQAR
jgi:hypothetical protein